MSQTSYSVNMAAAYVGGHALLTQVISARNNSAVQIPYGTAVAFDLNTGTTDLAVRLPAAAADLIRGVAMYDAAHESAAPGATGLTGIAAGAMLSVVREGQVWMITEQAAGPNDPVYVRYNVTGATGTTPALGQVRKSPDGVAEINTVTPTIGNATAYGLSFLINGQAFAFQVLSDASGTAQEICDAFRTVMAANAAFTALVVASGSTTLILTSQQAGVPQGIAVSASTTGAGGLAIVATTPAAPTAVLMTRWHFDSTAIAGGLILVDVNP